LYYDKLRFIAGRYFISKKSYSGSRIALCLNGQLRPGWRDSIKALIDSFSHLGNIDVFCILGIQKVCGQVLVEME
ncbi:hypothetical protein OLS49_04795, partial [Campylobacter jejuni]|nr:hypothetical protein [Campylobacter jejuni]